MNPSQVNSRTELADTFHNFQQSTKKATLDSKIHLGQHTVTFGALPGRSGSGWYNVAMAVALALIAVGICTILRQGALNAISSEKWVTNLAGGSGIGAGILLLYFSYSQKNKDPLVEFIKDRWLKPGAAKWDGPIHQNPVTKQQLLDPTILNEMALKIANVVNGMPFASMLIIKGYGPGDLHIIRGLDGNWTMETVNKYEAKYIFSVWIPAQDSQKTSCISIDEWKNQGNQHHPIAGVPHFYDQVFRQAQNSFTVQPNCPYDVCPFEGDRDHNNIFVNHITEY